MIEKGSMLYFANNGYDFMRNNLKDANQFKDEFLISAQQCVEKYLKVLMFQVFQEKNKTHNISYMSNRLREKYPEIRDKEDVVRFLRECYYDRRYENPTYIEIEDDEFEEKLEEVIELTDWLRSLANHNHMKSIEKSDHFMR